MSNKRHQESKAVGMLAELSPSHQKQANFIMSLSAREAVQSIASMPNSKASHSILSTCLEMEKAKSNRKSVLAKLKSRISKLPSPAKEVEVEVVDDTKLAASPRNPIEECNALHQLAQDSAAKAKELGEQAANYAILLGIRLKELKAQTAHGQWETLFNEKSKSESRFRFSSRTARKYIKTADGVLARKALAARDKKKIRKLATEDAKLTEKDHKLLNKATDGQTLQQLYLDLGIVRKTGHQTIDDNRNDKGGPKKPKKKTYNPNLDREDATEAFRTIALKLDKAFKCRHHLNLHPDTVKEIIEVLDDAKDQLIKSI